jgi:hypothetical protein
MSWIALVVLMSVFWSFNWVAGGAGSRARRSSG